MYQLISNDLLLDRWRLTLDLLGRVYIDDVGTESVSVIAELCGIPVKGARFRREMYVFFLRRIPVVFLEGLRKLLISYKIAFFFFEFYMSY